MRPTLRRAVRVVRALRRGDVLALAVEAVDALPSLSRKDGGWLYLLSNPATPGIYKCGYSNDPHRRAAELTVTGAPFAFVVEWTCATAHMRRDERTAHRALAAYRVGDARANGVRGEFFALPLPDAVRLVQSALGRTDADCWRH